MSTTIKIDDIDKLYVFDTLHDFWKERKRKLTKVTNNDEEDEDEAPIDLEKQTKIRKILFNFISSFLGIKKQDINNILSYLTSNNVTSVTSNYESSIEKYYETISPLKNQLFANTKQTYTYESIINEWEKWSKNKKNILPDLWIELNNSANNVKVITIEIDSSKDKKYTSFGQVDSNNKKNIIGNFILNFMFPNFNLNNPPNNAYFTFDAKAGVIKKIFSDINNVYNLITPANIADSAPTSYDVFLKNRNEFYFPGNNEFLFTSNFYTKNDNIKLSFVNNGYSSKNIYGFTFQININKSKYIITLPFSETQTQGPSVNYLIDFYLNPINAKPNSNKILNLSKLNQFKPLLTNGLLFDLKRGGDYEQVNSAIKAINSNNYPFTVVCTIDRLCALYARLNEQNVIFHVNETLYLYRFPKNIVIDKNIQLLQSLKYKSFDLLDSLTILKAFISKNIYENINDFKSKIITFLYQGKFKDPNKINASSYVENIVSIIIKFRLIDILYGLNKVINDNRGIESYNIDNLNNVIFQLETFINNPNLSEVNNINNLLTKYNNLSINNDVNELKTLFNLKSNFYAKEESADLLGLDYDFYDSNIFFKITGNCKSLQFSNKLYSTIYEYLNKFEKIINAKSNRNKNKNLYDKLHKFTYFTELNVLYESFFDTNPNFENKYKNSNKILGEILTNILKPDNIEDDTVLMWFNSLENVLKTTYLKVFEEENIEQYKPLLQYVQQNVPQHGGYKSTVMQYQYLSDLLRSISGISAGFIESIISTQFNQVLPDLPTLINSLKTNYLKECQAIIEEIQFIWISEIMSIQSNIENNYDYNPTSSEYIILFLLCFYSNGDYNDIDFDILNIFNPYYSQFKIDDDDKMMEGGGIKKMSLITENFKKHKYFSKKFDPKSTLKNSPNKVKINTKTRKFKRNTNYLKPFKISNQVYSNQVYSNTQINDIGMLYIKSYIHNIPAEIITILLLTLIDNTMQIKSGMLNTTFKRGYFYNLISTNSIPSNFFDNDASWKDLPRYIYTYVYYIITNIFNNEAFRLLHGGNNSI